MPSHSPAQARMMAAAAHDPKFAKKVGVPVSVAKDYNEADKGKRLAEAMKLMAKKKNEGG
jgi:ribosome assembly protein YihI (activator of Der GTPase)